ncbi:MAG: O-antigen ligase family protein [Candidatus Aminicenantales bacterium]
MGADKNPRGDHGNLRDRVEIALFILMLGSFLLRGMKDPWIGKSIANILPAFWAAGMIWMERRSFRKPSRRLLGVMSSGVVLVAWCLFCSAQSAFPRTGLFQSAKYAVSILVFWGAYSLSPRIHPACEKAVLRFLLVLGFLGLLELFFPAGPVWSILRGEGIAGLHPRISSVFLWPNQFGVIMGMAAAWTGYHYARNAEPGPFGRFLFWTMTVVGLWGLGQTGSRNAWACFLLASILFASSRGGSWRPAFVQGGVFLMIIAVFPIPYIQMGLLRTGILPALGVSHAASGDRRPLAGLNAVGNISLMEISTANRLRLFGRAWSDMRRRPLCGLGPGAFSESSGKEVLGDRGYNPHNIFLTAGAETGFPGLLLTILFFGGIALAGRRGPNAFLLAGGVMLAAQMIDCFVYDILFLVWWAVVAGLGTRAAHENDR